MPEFPDVPIRKEYVDATVLHRRVESTHRHGKHLFVRLADGPEPWHRLHFGMTGSLAAWKGSSGRTPGPPVTTERGTATGSPWSAERISVLFDEREPSVKRLIPELIEAAHRSGRPVGICWQAPGDHPESAEFLAECGIDSISVNPDSALAVLEHVARAEARMNPGEGS